MIRKRSRLLIVTVAVACISAAVGTAFAVTHDASDPLTRDQPYHERTSLEEIAAAASGRPGEIAPPCPDVATGTRLKQAGFAFGPCDPVSEAGAPVRIPEPGDEPVPTDDDIVCPAISGKVGVHVELPCAPGAKIVDADIFDVDGQYCVKLTYIPEKDSPSRTETLCEGDVPSVGGAPVRGPSGSD